LFKKLTIFLLLATSCMLLFVDFALSQEAITVIMPRHEMDIKGVWERQTREFEEKSGIKVELIQMAWERVADKIVTEMASGGSAFDVIEFDNVWPAKFLSAGWLISLNEFIDPATVDKILPGLVSTFSKDGHLYGMTWNNDTRFFMYNNEKLKNAGIAVPPKTWTEFTEQTKKLQTANLTKYGYAGAWEQSQTLTNEHAFFSYSFGSTLFTEDGKPTFTEQPAIDALTFMVEAINTEKTVDPASVTMNYEAVANVFYSGDTAFFLQAWPGVYAYSNDPSVSKIVGEIEVAEWIPAAREEFQATLTLPEALAIPATSQHKEAAWKYIEYMTSPEREKERALEIGTLPTWKDLFTDPDLLAQYPYWKYFGEQALYAKGHPKLTWFDEWAVNEQIEVQNALMGKKTPEQALKDLYETLKGNF